MTEKWDITVKVNLTIEYDEKGQRPSDVKQDAHAFLSSFDQYIPGAHAWACEVTGGKPGWIE